MPRTWAFVMIAISGNQLFILIRLWTLFWCMFVSPPHYNVIMLYLNLDAGIQFSKRPAYTRLLKSFHGFESSETVCDTVPLFLAPHCMQAGSKFLTKNTGHFRITT